MQLVRGAARRRDGRWEACAARPPTPHFSARCARAGSVVICVYCFFRGILPHYMTVFLAWVLCEWGPWGLRGMPRPARRLHAAR